MSETRAMVRETRMLISAGREAVVTTLASLRVTRQLINQSQEILRQREGTAMDRALSLEHLQQAEEHIAEGEHHIHHQREIIAALERGGHDTALAEEVLETFETTLTTHVTFRERLVEELRRDDASAESRSKE